MGNVTDSAGRGSLYLTFDLAENEQSAPIALLVWPEPNSLLVSTFDADVSVEARETGSGNPFTDIAGGLDLSSYPAGVGVSFDFRLVAGTPLAGLRRVPLRVVVATRGAAGWRL